MKKMIAAVPLVLVVTGIVVLGQQADPAQAGPQTVGPPRPKPAVPRLTFSDKTRLYLQKLGAAVDSNRSTPDMIVSSYADPKGGKTTVVVTNDRRKSLIGFYIYNFGSVKSVTNREEVFKYLLSANDTITLGSFFVDSDDDIGYKYLVGNLNMSATEFDTVYLTMAAVARERRNEIRQLLGLPPARDDKPADVKKAAEDKPPVN